MIQVKDLTKTYSNGKGVFDVTFDVKEGEVFGFLGPNGSGKTTTIRQLMGFTNADKGRCIINGLDTRKQAAKIQKILGYIPGEMAFFETLTGKEFLDFISSLRGFEDIAKRKNLTDRFELESDRKIRKMSKGMKQKIGLLAAFMHNPDILVLDEPTSGLDPLMQKRFIELIMEEKKNGKTILMSSHIFEEVDRTCERAAIIREGRIVALDNIARLKSSLQKSYLVTVAGSGDRERLLASGLELKELDSGRFELYIRGNYDNMLSVLSECKVTSLDASNQNLEQLFLRYYSKEEN